MYIGYPKFEIARKYCDKHWAHSVITWRNKFVDMANQLAEYDGELEEIIKQNNTTEINHNTKEGDEANFNNPIIKLDEKDYKFETEINQSSIQFIIKGVVSAKVEFFFIDLEILFSRSPFIKTNFDDFIYVNPNFTQTIHFSDLNDYKKAYAKSLRIAEEIKNKNMVLKLTNNLGNYNTLIYYNKKFIVNINEEEGMIKVINSDKIPMPKVYVKCFAKVETNVIFFIDGYTDLRGSFNYLDVKETEYTKITKFSILVVSEMFGSRIQECDPPKSKRERNDSEVILRGTKWASNQKCQM